MYQIRIAVALALGLASTASSLVANKRAVCTPLAEGFELIDDAVAINKAISDCGDGGTIVLPADQIYSIRSQLDFTPCRNCDFQLEGQFLISRDEWTYWNGVGSIIKVAGVHGAKIRSVTGTGFIDGNAIDYYYRTRTGPAVLNNNGAHFLHVTNGSSNILVDNLTVKNVPMRFFRVDGNSTKLTYSRLTLSVIEQMPNYPWSESETFGFEMGDVTDVLVDNVHMDFRSRVGYTRGGPPDRGIGVCAAFDKGTIGVTVKNTWCRAWGGAGVMVGTTVASISTGDTDRPGTPKLSNGRGVSNIQVSNLTFDSAGGPGAWAAGFKNLLEMDPERIFNITWDGVTVVNGSGIVADRCYLRCHCQTSHYYYCQQYDWMEAFDSLRFDNFKGAIGGEPNPASFCASNQTLCDIKISGWNPTVL